MQGPYRVPQVLRVHRDYKGLLEQKVLRASKERSVTEAQQVQQVQRVMLVNLPLIYGRHSLGMRA
jgi:hypothetical protein